MPDNFKITDFILPKDNTAIYLGSPELPRYKKQYYPQHPDFNNDMNAFFAMIEGNPEAPSWINQWSMSLIPILMFGNNKNNGNTKRRETIGN